MATKKPTAQETVKPIKRAKRVTAKRNVIDEAVAQAESQGIEVPTGKRIFAASCATFVLGFGTGTVINAIAEVVATTLFMLTGSSFLVFVVWLLAVLGAIYAGLKIGQHVGMYVLTGQIDNDIVRAKDYIVASFQRVKASVV